MDHMDDWRKRKTQRIQYIESGPYRRPPEDDLPEHERLLQEDPEYAWYHGSNPWRSRGRTSGMLKAQAAGAAFLFAAVWALFQWEHPAVERGQAFVRAALTQELRTEDVYAWYEARFGELPSFLPAWERVSPEAERVGADVGRAYVAPVAGRIVEPFGGVRSGAGVVVRTSGSSVASMDAGLVVYAGETQETGQTIVVRHPGGLETVYGYLGEIAVAKDDWVEAGATIGFVRPASEEEPGGLMYFAVKKGNSFIDPSDVVAL